jgi:hypothetical protein
MAFGRPLIDLRDVPMELFMLRSVGCDGTLQNSQFPFPTDDGSSRSPLAFKYEQRRK